MSSTVSHDGVQDLEEAIRFLATHGYRCLVRYDHLHAVRYLHDADVIGTKEREDERHLCLLEEFACHDGSTLLSLVDRVFRSPSCTSIPKTFSPLL